ncbi:hypothetical protein EV360DRAFT_92524 [Lentinula raphanica]|nr:hypothetical protein EV360DRAFT_92524 [Lentinula raphanica]
MPQQSFEAELMLVGIGSNLSPSTRLPQDALENKFCIAIDASQSFSTLIPKPPFDPLTVSPWSKTTCMSPLLDLVRRGCMREMYAQLQANMQGKQSAWDLYKNPFMDIRQTMRTIADNLDQRYKTNLVQDKKSKSAICIRFVKVRMIIDDTPVMMVLYRHGTRDSPSFENVKWVQQVMGAPLRQIVATAEEQKLLLAILNANDQRLFSTYFCAFALSFLLPVGPINQYHMGKSTHSCGCVVCGKKTNGKRSRCRAMEYCGVECQRAH